MFSFPWPWVWVPLISIIVIYISHKSKQNLSHFILFYFIFLLDLEKWMPIMQYYGSCMSVVAKKKKKMMMKSIFRWHTLIFRFVWSCMQWCKYACFWGSIRYSCIMHASILYTIRDQQNQSDRKYIWSFDFEDRLQKDWNGRLFIEKWKELFWYVCLYIHLGK